MGTENVAGGLVHVEDSPAGGLQVQDQEAHRVAIHASSQLLRQVVRLLQYPAIQSQPASFKFGKTQLDSFLTQVQRLHTCLHASALRMSSYKNEAIPTWKCEALTRTSTIAKPRGHLHHSELLLLLLEDMVTRGVPSRHHFQKPRQSFGFDAKGGFEAM